MSIQIALLSLISLAVTVIAGFSPADNYLLDCGSTTATTVDIYHRRFTGDDSSPVLSATQSAVFRNSNPDPNLSPIYHTARVFTKPSSYKFKINEKGTHLVRLHFQRFSFFGDIHACHAQFHVSANGRVLLYNFTVAERTNPRIKDFLIWVDDDELVINFIPVEKSSFAFVNAIEVISAPKDLIADVAQFVSSETNERIDGIKKYAYENVYRVNVGGVKVTPFNDSLWRTWVPDYEFLKLNDGSRKEYQVHFGGRINYRLGGASREVGPDNVYNSARVISSSTDSTPNLNMTWVFPVRNGFKYLVRLHFCDIASISLGRIYFNVYVDGNLAYENLDLTTLTNQLLASPFYADFVVDVEKCSGAIRVDVGPSNWSMPHSVDAILNGLEIWKMNNSMGSLDGEVLADQLISKSWSSGHVGRLLSLSGAVCLLVIAFLVMQRKTEAKESVGWSRLPVDVSEIDLNCNYSKTSL